MAVHTATLPFSLLELHRLRLALCNDRRCNGHNGWNLHGVLGRIESAIHMLDPIDEFHFPSAIPESRAA